MDYNIYVFYTNKLWNDGYKKVLFIFSFIWPISKLIFDYGKMPLVIISLQINFMIILFADQKPFFFTPGVLNSLNNVIMRIKYQIKFWKKCIENNNHKSWIVWFLTFGVFFVFIVRSRIIKYYQIPPYLPCTFQRSLSFFFFKNIPCFLLFYIMDTEIFKTFHWHFLLFELNHKFTHKSQAERFK